MVYEDLVFSWQRNGYLKLLTVKVNDRMVVIKEFVQGIIISVISVHALHYGLDDSQKHISVISLLILLES